MERRCCLVHDLRAIQERFNDLKPHFPELTEKRLDEIMRSVIEHYRVNEYKRHREILANFSPYKDKPLPSTHPSLDAVINGETTYLQMINEIGWEKFMTSKEGFHDMIIFHPGYLSDFKKDVEFLDETIRRVYWTYKPAKKV